MNGKKTKLLIMFLFILAIWNCQDSSDKEKIVDRIQEPIGPREAKERLYREFFQAIELGKVDKIKQMLENGIDVNSEDFGKRPLHWAAELDNLEVLKILLENGASVKPDKAGNTPLHYSTSKGQYEISEYLISKGTNVNAVNWSGITPLHYASQRGAAELVSLLIANGANVNAVNQNLETPLDMTISEEVKKILRDAGGKPYEELK